MPNNHRNDVGLAAVTEDNKAQYIECARAEAANAMSIEAYSGFLEICRDLDLMSGEDLKLYEGLPIEKKATLCAYNALTCKESTAESREYARQLLHRFM